MTEILASLRRKATTSLQPIKTQLVDRFAPVLARLALLQIGFFSPLFTKIKNALNPIIIRVAPYSGLNDQHFRAAFGHGLSLLFGAMIGLGIWLLFQPTPINPLSTYRISVPFERSSITRDPSIGRHGMSLPQSSPSRSDTTTNTDAPPRKVTLPEDGLTENKPPYGPLPILRSSDNLRPFDAYRLVVGTDILNKPIIAVALLDYGLSGEASGSILDVMPGDISVVISQAATDANQWAQKAFDRGHEVWLQLTVEPNDYPDSDPGSNALLTAAPTERNLDSLMKQLGHSVGYAGAFIEHPSPYIRSGADADFAALHIFERGLGLMVNDPQTDRIVRSESDKFKAPFYAGHMFDLEEVNDDVDFSSQIDRVEKFAQNNGYAILLFRPTPYARKAVLNWIQTLKSRGFATAPLSVLAERGADLTPLTER